MKNFIQNNFQRKLGWQEAVVASLLFHLIGMFQVVDLTSYLQSRSLSDKTDEPTPIRIKLRSVDKLLSRPKQIVNSTESANKKRHKDAKFLGEFTQTVDRETTATKTGSFKDAGLGVRNGANQVRPSKKQAAAKEIKRKMRKAIKKIDFSDLSFAKTKHLMPKAAPLGLKNGKVKSRGLSQSNDFIEEVPLGDMTALNTVETKYYGFYHRIRQRLEQYWGNTLNKKVISMFKRGRTIASETNHITSLKIHLDSKGNIIDILIKTTSGIQELDDAAIESFSKAGPFPNPPVGMIKNGVATLEWGFVVKG